MLPTFMYIIPVQRDSMKTVRTTQVINRVIFQTYYSNLWCWWHHLVLPFLPASFNTYCTAILFYDFFLSTASVELSLVKSCVWHTTIILPPWQLYILTAFLLSKRFLQTEIMFFNFLLKVRLVSVWLTVQRIRKKILVILCKCVTHCTWNLCHYLDTDETAFINECTVRKIVKKDKVFNIFQYKHNVCVCIFRNGLTISSEVM